MGEDICRIFWAKLRVLCRAEIELIGFAQKIADNLGILSLYEWCLPTLFFYPQRDDFEPNHWRWRRRPQRNIPLIWGYCAWWNSWVITLLLYHAKASLTWGSRSLTDLSAWIWRDHWCRQIQSWLIMRWRRIHQSRASWLWSIECSARGCHRGGIHGLLNQSRGIELLMILICLARALSHGSLILYWSLVLHWRRRRWPKWPPLWGLCILHRCIPVVIITFRNVCVDDISAALRGNVL